MNRNQYIAPPRPKQSILSRRANARSKVPPPSEADFWRSFNLDKFARDWRRGVGRPKTSPR
jgi:hypothetical protein